VSAGNAQTVCLLPLTLRQSFDDEDDDDDDAGLGRNSRARLAPDDDDDASRPMIISAFFRNQRTRRDKWTNAIALRRSDLHQPFIKRVEPSPTRKRLEEVYAE
jgi:hypothetical protein